MGFSRQEYWSGLPFPSPVDLPHPGIEPGSPALEADVLTSEPPGKPNKLEEDSQAARASPTVVSTRLGERPHVVAASIYVATVRPSCRLPSQRLSETLRDS